MFSSSDKTTKNVQSVHPKAAGTSFFRKTEGDPFFGRKGNPSFFGKPLQAKLTVSTPDDPHEKEADAVADKVMRMPAPLMASSLPEKKEEKLQRKEEEEVQAKQETPVIKIQCKESPGRKLQAKLDSVIFRSEEKRVDARQEAVAANGTGQNISRKNISLYASDTIQQSGRGPPTSSIPFEQTLASSKGGGSALPGDTRTFMESRFNADFSGVRIHTGSTAEHLSSSVNAKAFAHGNDIYFNSGKFSPHTSDGNTLLAHELTHTIQQGASKTINPSQGSNTPVARKKIIHRNTQSSNEVNKSPGKDVKTTASKDLNILKKKEAGPAKESIEVKAVKAREQHIVAPKPALSNWSVKANGNLHSQAVKVIDKAGTDKDLQKKEERKEEKEKLPAGTENKIHKKSIDEINADSARKVEQEPSAPPTEVICRSSFESKRQSSPDEGAFTNPTYEVKERGPPLISAANAITVNRSAVDDALSFAGSVMDCVSLSLDTAIKCAKEKAQQVALHIPGYKALRVVLGEDPITGESIPFNGRNFIEAAFDIMPGGNLLHKKLDELHKLDDAAKWIDEKIGTVQGLVRGLIDAIKRFWKGLGITDLASPLEVLKNGANIVLGFIKNVIDFAIQTGKELLKMVKDFLLGKIVEFIKTKTTAYPLLTVILGKDPVTEQEVPANGTTILNALLELGGEEGKQQKKQMDDTGTFQKVAGYIDEGITVFSGAYQQIVQAFHNIWNIVSIESLMDPVGTFTKIYDEFATPVKKVWDFIKRVGAEILKFIKEVLMVRLSNWAKTVKGYALVTVIIGKDPFTGAEVPRTVENIIHGFMSLMDGGEEQFKQMKESGAISKAEQKINAAVKRLNMTPQAIIQLFIDLWNSFSIKDLINPIAAFQRILAKFGEPIARLIAFVVEIIKIVVEVILIIMQFPFDLINNIIAKAMQAFDKIKADPIGFLKNLLRAIKEGFVQFFGNILKHLLAGLTGWLMSELKDANVKAPKDFSLGTIIGWVLDLLGISMEKIWDKLAKHPKIGPERVAKIRGMISKLEGIWTFIKDVQERGMAAIWDKIVEKLSNLWDTVLDAIKNWIMEQIVNKMVTKLLSMLDPTGIMAVVNSAIALYSAIQSFIKYLKQMLEIVNSFVEGVLEIANGNTKKAANFLENTLARAVPIVIGFLANQVGLSGVGKKVGEMIEKVRDMVDKALTWLVNKAVDTGINLLDKVVAGGKAIIAKLKKWLGLEKTFKADDGQQHKLYFTGSEDNPVLMVQTNPVAFSAFISSLVVGTDEKKIKAKNEAVPLAESIDAKRKEPLAGATEEEKEKSKAKKLEDVEKLLDKLSIPSAVLFGDLSAVGEPEIVNSTQSAGHAITMSAKKLNNKQKRKGSPPTSANTASYAVLNTRRQSASASYYVKGHMLNDNIGGLGVWDNLTPLSREGNSAHEGTVESLVKAAYSSGAVVEYNVTAIYGYGNNASSIPDSDPQKVEKLKIIAEEKNVPTGLQCDAWVLEKKGDAFERKQSVVSAKVNNPVGQDAASYNLGDSSTRPDIYLNSSDVSVIATIENFGAQMALKVGRAHTETGKGRFNSYSELSKAKNKDGTPIFDSTEEGKITSLSGLKYVKLYKA